MRSKLVEWILVQVVTRLQIGAHCGLCGAWMEHELIYRDWPWSICATCAQPDKGEA